MESAPFFTPDPMVLSVWALPQPDLCILRVEKTARFLNQRSGGVPLNETSYKLCFLLLFSKRGGFRSRKQTALVWLAPPGEPHV